MKTQDNKAKKEISEKKRVLINLSKTVKKMMDLGQIDCVTINEGIMSVFYLKDGHEEFNTYKQWKELGYQVKKGSKSFPVWAKPRKVEKQKEGEEQAEEKYEFYPTANLFSNLQVEPIENVKAA